MNKDIRDLLIGVVAIAALATDVDGFTLRQALLGVLLFLFLIHEWQRQDTKYEQVLYAAVAGCCGLLVLGFLSQELLNAFGKARWREETFSIVWLVTTVLVFLVRRPTQKRGG